MTDDQQETGAAEPSITFSVRELLGRMDAKLDSLIAGLALKADRTDLDNVARRVGAVEDRAGRLEEINR